MAAAASQQRRVVITLYKALLRGAGAADAAGKAGSAPVAALGELARLTGGARSGVAAVKARFAEGRAAAGARADAAVASALTALPQVNALVAALKAQPVAEAEAEAEGTDACDLPLGTVIRHARSGYRGVVIGWDEACRASGEWVAATGARALPHGTAQRYFYVLVDCRDRPGATVAYLPRDVITRLSPGGLGMPAAGRAPARAVLLLTVRARVRRVRAVARAAGGGGRRRRPAAAAAGW